MGNQIKILSTIQELVEANQLKPAKELLNDYRKLFPQQVEAISIQAVIALVEGELFTAEAILQEGLQLDPNNFELLFNKAYLLECKNNWTAAYNLYESLETYAIPKYQEQLVLAKQRVADVIAIKRSNETKPKLKLAVFVKPQMDSFLGDILSVLETEYDVSKCQPQTVQEIDDKMDWADICWFEWCDDLIIYASDRPVAKEKIIICRLHSYEAFTEYPAKVKWDNVDCLLFVAEHIRDFVVEQFSISRDKTAVVPNGIDLDKFSFKKRKHGFNIAYVGYINYKKGPMLLLHTFKAMHDRDARYKLYIAGQFQDHRDVLYFQQMTKEFGLEKSVVFTGWQDDLNSWLEDKNYILCTSILESQNISVMQAMAKGIKPLVHNFVGARGIYDEHYLWNTIDEAVNLVLNSTYDSTEYCDFIKTKYDKKKVLQCLNLAVSNVVSLNRPIEAVRKNSPLVTVGITVFNGEKFLARSIDSVLKQTYPNIEILVVDNCSTDGSRKIIKKYEKKYANVRGIYHAINSGGPLQGVKEIISTGSGEYCQWLCCDDSLDEQAIELFVGYLERNPDIDYVYSDMNIIDEQDRKTSEWNYTVFAPDKVVEHIFKTGSGIIPMFGLQRKHFLEEKQISWFMPENDLTDYSCDTLNQLHFIRYGWRYGKIDKGVINYRMHSDNFSHSLKKRILASILLYEYIIEHFAENIYLPEVSWNELENKEQYKSYCIAAFYMALIENHVNKQAIPAHLNISLTQKDLYECSAAYYKQGLVYLQSALEQGKTYEKLIEDLQSQYNLIKDKMAELGIILQ